MSSARDNMDGWIQTLQGSKVIDGQLIDPEGYEVYFLSVENDEDGPNILLTYGGPGLRVYATDDPRELMFHGYSMDEDYREIVTLPEEVTRAMRGMLHAYAI